MTTSTPDQTRNELDRELHDEHGKHRYEDECMRVVRDIRATFLPSMDTNDGGEILGWLTSLCTEVVSHERSRSK